MITNQQQQKKRKKRDKRRHVEGKEIQTDTYRYRYGKKENEKINAETYQNIDNSLQMSHCVLYCAYLHIERKFW